MKNITDSVQKRKGPRAPIGRNFLAAMMGIPMCAAAQIDLRLTQITDLQNVSEITHAGDGSGRMFLVQASGTVWIYDGSRLLDEPFLDIADRTEYGLMDIAFPPDFASSGRFYVHYMDDFGDPNALVAGFHTVSRFHISEESGNADESSEEKLIVFRPLRATGQDGLVSGGEVEFGSDGMLYIAFGDAEPRLANGETPPGNPQDLGSINGKILRIDVSPETDYSIPADNPFVNEPGALGEIWAYGIQNPNDLSLDRQTGDLYFADSETEFNRLPSGVGGLNFGWPFFEGVSCNPEVPPCRNDPTVTAPILDFTADQNTGDGSSTVWHGQLYSGLDYPALSGSFLHTENARGRIFTLFPGDTAATLLADQYSAVEGTGNSAMGEDEVGNVFLAVSSVFRESGVFLISDGEPAAQSRPIVGQHTGTYVVAGLPDQGFFLTVGENEAGPFLFFAWFTFMEGEPFWLVGIEFFSPGDGAVVIPVSTRRGPGFLDFSGTSVQAENLGEMAFTAESCDQFRVDYAFGKLGSGTLQLERLTGVKDFDCE